jgi:hypothetical protein
MEVLSVTLEHNPVYFEYQTINEKWNAWKNFEHMVGLYRERYGVEPTLAMLSPEDYQEITATEATPDGLYLGVEIFWREYVSRGVFRFRLPLDLTS